MVLSFKNCFYSSLGLHLLIISFFSSLTNNGRLVKPIVVFGTYSKKNYHTIYKCGVPKQTKNAVSFSCENKGLCRSKSTLRSSGSFSKNHSTPCVKNTHSGSWHKKTLSRVRTPKLNSNETNKTKTNSSISTKCKKIELSRQKITKAQVVQHLAKLKKIETALNKSSELSSRQLISDPSNKKIKLTPDLVKKQKEIDRAVEIELEKQRKQEEVCKKKQEIAELEKINKSVELEIENELKAHIEDDKDLAQNVNPQTTVDELGAVEVSEKDLVGENEDTCTLILSLHEPEKLDTALYQKCVQQEVERLWKPPVGVPRGTTCRIEFVVDKNGCVKNFEISKRSNILIYDLSVLRIAHLFKFNKKLWGKSFKIDFCQ